MEVDDEHFNNQENQNGSETRGNNHMTENELENSKIKAEDVLHEQNGFPNSGGKKGPNGHHSNRSRRSGKGKGKLTRKPASKGLFKCSNSLKVYCGTCMHIAYSFGVIYLKYGHIVL